MFTRLKFAKYRKRALTIAANSFNSLLLPLFNMVIAYFVIRFASVKLWGEFVNWLIIVQLGAHIIAWGNKEYLLRAFSRTPSRITIAWQTSFLSRFGLTMPFCLIFPLLADSMMQAIGLMLWGLSLVIFQSLDVFVVYKKDFLFVAVAESILLMLLTATIIILGTLTTLPWLIWLFGSLNLAKASLYLWRYQNFIRPQTLFQLSPAGRFRPTYFTLALPFFLLGFSGMLQSRIDLYAVNLFLSQAEVGQYQVFINLMLYLQAVSLFILLPFVKSIYRLQYNALQKMAARLFSFGLLFLLPALGGVHLLLTLIYQFQLSLDFLLVGGLFVLPVYGYLPIIYALYKAEQETTVLKMNIGGAILNFLLNLFLLPQVGLIGAIIASAIVQWLMLGVYLMYNRHLKGNYAPALPETL